MNVVTTYPQTWKLPVKQAGDGTIEEILEKAADDSAQIDNVVFKGSLRYISHVRKKAHSVHHLFKDEQSGVVLRFSPSTIEAMFHAVAKGSVSVRRGLYEGLFTFATYAGWIFATPLSETDAAVLGIELS